MATESERERLIYPDVVASTVMGDDRRYMVEAVTNNQDTTVRVYMYWYIPSDGGEPVLMIEIDDEDEPGGLDPTDIRIRIRRNDGLVYEANREETKYIKERP
jgi:hypothetical protein